MKREIQEEMSFTQDVYEFLGRYDFSDWSANVYFLEVDDDFERKVKIMEGEYGKFFSEDEVSKEPMMIKEDKDVLENLYQLLHKKA